MDRTGRSLCWNTHPNVFLVRPVDLKAMPWSPKEMAEVDVLTYDLSGDQGVNH